MSSSTSSSEERPWKRCFLGSIACGAGLVILTWLAIVIIDPFETLHLAPSLPRQPVAHNQRYVYPALARQDAFDSIVCGTSTARLLDPRILDEHLGGSFLNLSMNAASRFEQMQILQVFTHKHPSPRTLVLGLDAMWLSGARYEPLAGKVAFPKWMYDENPWNDYTEHFNWNALQKTWWQTRQLLGVREPYFRQDGYRVFLPDESGYDLEKARRIIREQDRDASLLDESNPSFDLETLDQVLDLFPEDTLKILFLAPTHVVTHRGLGDARESLVARLSDRPNVLFVDFMFASPWTTKDENYWDGVHCRIAVANGVCRLLGEARDPAFESEVCRVLVRR